MMKASGDTIASFHKFKLMSPDLRLASNKLRTRANLCTKFPVASPGTHRALGVIVIIAVLEGLRFGLIRLTLLWAQSSASVSPRMSEVYCRPCQKA